jgi:hypothetical protein
MAATSTNHVFPSSVLKMTFIGGDFCKGGGKMKDADKPHDVREAADPAILRTIR